jgi:hypothetical protein
MPLVLSLKAINQNEITFKTIRQKICFTQSVKMSLKLGDFADK